MVFLRNKVIVLLSVMVFMLANSSTTKAATAGEIDASVKATLESFYKTVSGGEKLATEAEGVLVFPDVVKAGIFLLGGEYGEGALIVDGAVVDYYNTASGAFGWQLGIQKKAILILFMQEAALNKFRADPSWKIGVDASVAIITEGLDGSIDSSKLNKPIVAFVIDQKGLMYNLTLEGTKVTKLKK